MLVTVSRTVDLRADVVLVDELFLDLDAGGLLELAVLSLHVDVRVGYEAAPLQVVDLAALGERLRKRKSPYAWIMLALQSIASGKPLRAELEGLLAEPDDDPADLAALDRAWEDEPVIFGPGALSGGVAPGGGCPAVRGTLARMDPPADPKLQ